MGQRITSILPTAVVADTGDVHAPSSNVAAVVTYPASTDGSSHHISGIAWSYAGASDPTGGNLKVEDGSGNVVFTMDVTAKGAGVIDFVPHKRGTANRAMIITLAAGGSGITGKLSVPAHWTE